MEWNNNNLRKYKLIIHDSYDDKYMKNKSCDYCGGEYKVVFLINGYKICPVCRLVSHIKYNTINNIVIIYSKLSQLDIVRKSVEYIMKKSCLPCAYDLDPSSELINLSIIEYYNIITNKMPIKFNNYKIIISKVPIGNLGIKYSPFVKKTKLIQEINIHKFSKKEKEYIDEQLDNTDFKVSIIGNYLKYINENKALDYFNV